MKIYASAGDLIGNTPLLELTGIEKKLRLDARILAKLECFNPGGSVKDRVARAMIDAAEKAGVLKPGATIIEPTSGNTGIGLAAQCAARGYKFIATMPDTMSIERRKLMEAYGAAIELTPGAEGIKGAIARAEQLQAEIPGAVITGQFANPANPAAHRLTTGPEIYADTDGKVDIFVSAAGTGGTVTGVGEYLKAVKPQVKIVVVEPAESPVLAGGKAGPHKIQGIGPGFVPQILDNPVYDEIIAIPGETAMETARLIGKTEGILVGISSGAAAAAAIELAKKEENAGKIIVALFADNGERYLSTELYSHS